MQTTPLALKTLAGGYPGITPVFGASLAEAAAVTLESQGHSSPSGFRIEGDITHEHELSWDGVTTQAERCWNDLEEAAEHGAYGIAALIIAEHTGFEVVERSRKGTGFDYWLGEKGQQGFLFQSAARLEVSGIQNGTSSVVRSRIKQKLKQTEPTDGTLPALVIVVEYGTPLASVATK